MIRINNIEFREEQGSYVIVCWYPNSYYGKEQDFLDAGYEWDGGNLCRDFIQINKSCFEHPQSCVTIAYLYVDVQEHDVSLKTCGSRLLKLEGGDKEDFWRVYDAATDYLLEKMDVKICG